MAGLPDSRPLLCYITDRQTLASHDPLPVIQQAVAAGVDLVQIRERDLSTKELLALVEEAVACARGRATRILVNDRLEVALAAGAAGVHLPARGLPVAEVRRSYPGLLVGASCHDLEELRRAEEGGADLVVFGPVFKPLSKATAAPAVGVDKLAQAVRAVKIPVLALGGITLANAAQCLRTGAAGLAAITLFQQASDRAASVARLRALAST